eukprot:13785394-Alexandrium_andersonii.AAC.1
MTHACMPTTHDLKLLVNSVLAPYLLVSFLFFFTFFAHANADELDELRDGEVDDVWRSARPALGGKERRMAQSRSAEAHWSLSQNGRNDIQPAPRSNTPN